MFYHANQTNNQPQYHNLYQMQSCSLFHEQLKRLIKLLKNGYNYMADILLIFSTSKSDIYPTLPMLTQIIPVLKQKGLKFVLANPHSLHCILPLSALVYSQCSHYLSDLCFSIIIELSQWMISVKAIVLYQNCSEVRVESYGQRGFLIKMASEINRKNSRIQTSINPITGSIAFCTFSKLANNHQISDISQIILNSLTCIKQNSQTIIRFIQATDMIPGQFPAQFPAQFPGQYSNTFYKQFITKTQSIAPLLITHSKIVNNQHIIPSHKMGSLVFKNTTSLLSRMKKFYVDQRLNSFVQNSSKTKTFNFMYISLDLTPSLIGILKEIQLGDALEEGQTRIHKLRGEGTQFNLEFKVQKLDCIRYQYAVVDKVARMKNYLSCFKTYIVVRNYLQLTSHYIISMCQSSGSSLTLVGYLDVYGKNLSIQTKLKILLQISSVACICLQRLDFQPSFSGQNLQIDFNLKIRLINLGKSSISPKLQLLQLFYWLIFERKYYILKNNQLKNSNFLNPTDDYLSKFGPAPVLRVLVRALACFEEDIANCCNLENFILILGRTIDVLEQLLIDDKELDQFS